VNKRFGNVAYLKDQTHDMWNARVGFRRAGGSDRIGLLGTL
jgi:hypothetical protein